MILDSFPPFTDFLQQGFQYSRREDDYASEDSAALWMYSEDEFSANTKVRAPSTNSPEQIRVFRVVDSKGRPICRYDSSLVYVVKVRLMWSGGDVAYLEKVVDNEAMLASEEAETSPKEEPANDMRHGSHDCKLRTYPATPVCLLVSTGIKYKSE